MNVKRNMDTYIFITDSVQRIGGIELYISAKKCYLEKMGWNVIVISTPIDSRKVALKELENSLFFLPLSVPPFSINKVLRELTITDIVKRIKKIGEGNFIIESHNDKAAPWGELIAERLNAKHIVVLLDEIEFGKGIYYKDYQHFYGYKFRRKEMSGIRNTKLILEGYINVEDKDCVRFFIDENPVRDIKDIRVDHIQSADWTICYIGRTNKSYVPTIIKEVAEFAYEHKEKLVQFVIVGDCFPIKPFINSISKIDNLIITMLGELIPIPRELYSKVDVVIAGSGSARYSAAEGVPTIAADSQTNKAIGYLGYNTQSSIWADPRVEEISFKDSLEALFVNNVLENMQFEFSVRTTSECYEQNMKFIDNSEQSKVYYDFSYENNTIHPSFNTSIKSLLALRIPRIFMLYLDIKTIAKRILRYE